MLDKTDMKKNVSTLKTGKQNYQLSITINCNYNESFLPTMQLKSMGLYILKIDADMNPYLWNYR